MSSLVYQICLDALAQGKINFSADRFKVMLVGDSYVPSKGHRIREEISGEIDGVGYALGGISVNAAVEGSSIRLGGFTLNHSTLTARRAVYYKDSERGPWVDILIACVDFGKDVSSRDGPFTLTDSAVNIT